MKETAIVFGNRPLAAVPASDLNLEHLGNMLDEDIAIRLGFIIRDLQYGRISLSNANLNRKSRITGRIRSTVQSISNGRAGISVCLNAKVVRDLYSLTGAELIADVHFFKKLAGNFKKEERDRDTSDIPITGPHTSSAVIPTSKGSIPTMDANTLNIKKKSTPNITTSPNIMKELSSEFKRVEEDSSLDEDSACSSERNCSECKDFTDSSCDSSTTNSRPRKYWIRCAMHGEAHARASVRKDLHHDEEDSFSDSDTLSDSGSSRDCSSCAVYSSCSSEEEGHPHNHRMRCALHAEAHLKAYTRKVNICRVRGRNNKLLREAASKVTEEEVDAERIRRAKSRKTPDEDLDECFPGGAKFAHQLSDRWAKEKAKKDKLDENKKQLKLKFGLTENDFEIRRVARNFRSESD